MIKNGIITGGFVFLICSVGVGIYLTQRHSTGDSKAVTVEQQNLIKNYKRILNSLLDEEQKRKVTAINDRERRNFEALTDEQKLKLEPMCKRRLEAYMGTRAMRAYLEGKKPSDISVQSLEKLFGTPHWRGTNAIVYIFANDFHSNKWVFDLEKGEITQVRTGPGVLVKGWNWDGEGESKDDE